MPFAEISRKELLKVVKKLPKKFSRGADNITYNMIKAIADSDWLLDIFNYSLLTGEVPKCWKHANFIALPKSMNKWRPIALLSNLAKTLERIVAGRLKDLLPRSDRQFAAYGGTQMALNELQKFIQSHENSKYPCYVVFFDVSKAFDRVHIPTLYKLLKGKLPEYLLRWVIHYFSDRTGNLGNANVDIPNGVPQGSVLGPLMFQVYISDLLKELPDQIYHALYADDFVIGVGGVSAGIATRLLNQSLELIGERCNALSITLDTKKTCAMWIKKHTKPKKYNKLPLTLLARRLNFVKNYKYLGVIIDNRLRCTTFVEQKLKQAKKRSALVFRLYGLTTAQYRTLWLGSVESYFRYGLKFVAPFLSDALMDRLRGFYYTEARKISGALVGTLGADACWLARLHDFDDYMLFESRHILPKPPKKETLHLKPGLNARSIEINYVRWITGVQWSRSHLMKHHIRVDGSCRYCHAALETRDHILFECLAPELRVACLKFLKTCAGIVGMQPIKNKNVEQLLGATYNTSFTHGQRVKIARALFEYCQDIEYYT